MDEFECADSEFVKIRSLFGHKIGSGLGLGIFIMRVTHYDVTTPLLFYFNFHLTILIVFYSYFHLRYQSNTMYDKAGKISGSQNWSFSLEMDGSSYICLLGCHSIYYLLFIYYQLGTRSLTNQSC